jgi:hypothetical protein
MAGPADTLRRRRGQHRRNVADDDLGALTDRPGGTVEDERATCRPVAGGWLARAPVPSHDDGAIRCVASTKRTCRTSLSGVDATTCLPLARSTAGMRILARMPYDH